MESDSVSEVLARLAAISSRDKVLSHGYAGEAMGKQTRHPNPSNPMHKYPPSEII